jgi:uncharacterized protein YfkK (UPF0435 family)
MTPFYLYKYRQEGIRFMDVLQNKTNKELLQSMLAETAKTLNEVNCSIKDNNKARNRLTFQLAVLNEMINREED